MRPPPMCPALAFPGSVPSFPGFVGADGSVRPAKHASETRKSSANSQLPLGGQGRPPLRRLGGFCVPGLDIFGKSDILKIARVLPANRQPPLCVTRSNRRLGRWGGYFFLLLQALTFFHLPFILQIKEVLPANGRAPRNYLQEVTAGLLCRAVTSFCRCRP